MTATFRVGVALSPVAVSDLDEVSGAVKFNSYTEGSIRPEYRCYSGRKLKEGAERPISGARLQVNDEDPIGKDTRTFVAPVGSAECERLRKGGSVHFGHAFHIGKECESLEGQKDHELERWAFNKETPMYAGGPCSYRGPTKWTANATKANQPAIKANNVKSCRVMTEE